MLARLRDHAAQEGWVFDAVPYAEGYRARITRGAETLEVHITPTGFVHPLGRPSSLYAAVLIWKATMPTFGRGKLL